MLYCFSFKEKNSKIDTDVKTVIGEQGSIGVLIMANDSAEDRTIPDGAPSSFITESNNTNLVESSSRQSL